MATTPPPQETRTRSRRPLLLLDPRAFRLLLAAIGAVVLTVASVPILNLTAHAPQRTVVAYLSALEDGDASRALSLLAAPATRNTAALDDAVLAGAWSLPSGPRVVDSRIDGDRATVTVRFTLGDASHEETYSLVRAAPHWGLFDRWLIAVDKWPRLGLDVTGSSVVEINGVAAPADRGGVPLLFPAGYTVGFNAEYLRSDPVRVDVLRPGEIAPVTLDPEPTEALAREVAADAVAQLDACAEQTTLMPTDCPFGFETDHEILGGAVAWSIVEHPAITLASSGTQLTIAPAEAVVEVSGRSRDIVTAYESDFTERIIVRITGVVTVADGTVSVALVNEGQSLGQAPPAD